MFFFSGPSEAGKFCIKMLLLWWGYISRTKRHRTETGSGEEMIYCTNRDLRRVRAEDLVCRPASKRGWVESVCSVQRWRRRLGPTGRWWLRRRPTGRQQRPTGRQRRPTGRWQRWWRRPTGGQGEGREPLEADGPCWGLGLCWNAGHHWRWIPGWIPGQRHRTAEQGARSQGARTRLGTWLSRYLVRQPGSQEMRYLGTDRPCSWPGVTFRFSCSLVQEGTVA